MDDEHKTEATHAPVMPPPITATCGAFETMATVLAATSTAAGCWLNGAQLPIDTMRQNWLREPGRYIVRSVRWGMMSSNQIQSRADEQQQKSTSTDDTDASNRGATKQFI